MRPTRPRRRRRRRGPLSRPQHKSSNHFCQRNPRQCRLPFSMAPGDSAQTPQSVRDAALDVMRARELTTLFANPGSTEIAFLAGLPDDFKFVLGLHEGAVVGMATGYALGRG